MSETSAVNANIDVTEECEIALNCFLQVCDEVTREGMSENDREIIRYGCEKLGFPAGSPGERVYKVFLLGIYAGIRLSCDIDANSAKGRKEATV